MRQMTIMILIFVLFVGATANADGHESAEWSNPDGGEFFCNWNWSPSSDDPSVYEHLWFRQGKTSPYIVKVLREGTVGEIWVDHDQVKFDLSVSPMSSGSTLTADEVVLWEAAYSRFWSGCLHAHYVKVFSSSDLVVCGTEITLAEDGDGNCGASVNGGALTVQDGGRLNCAASGGWLAVSAESGTSAVTVTGRGTSVDAHCAWVGADASVSADSYSGTMSIKQGAAAQFNILGIGQGAEAKGSVHVGRDSTLVTQNSCTVGFGEGATGTLDIAAGGRVANHELVFVGDYHGVGTVSIDGGSMGGAFGEETAQWVSDCAFLNIGYLAGQGTVNLDNVATAICKGSLWVGCGGGTGTLNVHGGSHFDVTSDVKIGDGYEDQETEEKWNGKGTIHVHGCAPGAVIQPNDSSASSSVLSIGGCISVGWPLSEGYFKISSGASASSKGAELGVLAGGVANVTIDGEYSRWANEGDIRTGTGKTTLTVQNNGSLENQGRLDFYSGENALYISSGGHIKTTTGISAGGVDSQTSLCIVDGGLFDVTGGSMLGQGGRVDVLVSGVNSMWSQSNAGSVEESMVLGQSGEGLLTIKSGGTVNVNNLSTAVSSNSTGKLVVEDVDAKLKVSNALCVGVSGKGSLAVNARASAVAESITVGQLAGSTGSVSVVGRDASLRSSMSVLGGLGTASLTISGGGYVENANAVVAGCAGSESTVTVSEGIGSDSAVWTIHDALIVGGSESSNVYTSGGVGTLNVDGPNALVHIGKRLILGDDAKVNIASSGMITIGEMNAASQTGLIVGQGGILEGTGTISASVLNRGGTICPGHSPGILHVASLDNSEGTIVLEVCGSTEGQYDQIVVDGQLTLGGDIQIAFVNGYVPRPTDKFAFFKCSSLVNLTDAHVVAPNDVSEGRLTAMDGVVSFVVPSTIGTLSISTTPVNGEVFVDGESWGITPVSKKIAAGQHTVSFGSMDNCSAPTDQIATVTADQTTTITGTYVSAEGNEDGDDGSSGGMCGAAGVMAILATVLAGLCLGYTGTKE